MMETAEKICGKSKGTSRHKETWWWNEQVAYTVQFKVCVENRGKKDQKTHWRSIRRVSFTLCIEREIASDLYIFENQNQIF